MNVILIYYLLYRKGDINTLWQQVLNTRIYRVLGVICRERVLPIDIIDRGKNNSTFNIDIDTIKTLLFNTSPTPTKCGVIVVSPTPKHVCCGSLTPTTPTCYTVTKRDQPP